MIENRETMKPGCNFGRWTGARAYSISVLSVVLLVVSVGCSKSPKNRPPGEITAYKPVTYFGKLRRNCGGGCKVLKMVAKGVAATGTMDLTDNKVLVTIEFKKPKGSKAVKRSKKRKIPKGETKAQKKKRKKREKAERKAEKKAKKSAAANKGKYERQVITIPKIGGSRKHSKIVMGFASRPHNVPSKHATTVMEPKCKMLDLWNMAQEKGANPADLATVTYDRDGYLFELANFKMAFDLQCKPRWKPSDSKSLRPVESFAGAASVAPKSAEFSELVARQVNAEGIALTSSDTAWVRYKFFWEEPLKSPEEVQIWLRDGELRKDRKFMTLGSKPLGITPPTCKFSQLWTTALEHGADKAKTAAITYNNSGYVFRQEDPILSLKFGADCKMR